MVTLASYTTVASGRAHLLKQIVFECCSTQGAVISCTLIIIVCQSYLFDTWQLLTPKKIINHKKANVASFLCIILNEMFSLYLS